MDEVIEPRDLRGTLLTMTDLLQRSQAMELDRRVETEFSSATKCFVQQSWDRILASHRLLLV
jgi:hypothetical protein